MVDRQPRRVAVLRQRLGGPPAGFAVGCVLCTVLIFPFRLLIHHGEPAAETFAGSAMQAVFAMAAAVAARAGQRQFDATQRGVDNHRADEAAAMQAPARRGAIVGLSVAVVFFGGLLALCLLSGRPWILSATFGVTLVALATRSIVRLRHDSPG